MHTCEKSDFMFARFCESFPSLFPSPSDNLFRTHTLYKYYRYVYLEQFCISLFYIYFMHIRAKLIQRESVYYVFTSDFPDYKFFSKLGTEWKINFKMVKQPAVERNISVSTEYSGTSVFRRIFKYA